MYGTRFLLSCYKTNLELYNDELSSSNPLHVLRAKRNIIENVRRAIKTNIDSKNANDWRLQYRVRSQALADLQSWFLTYAKAGEKFRKSINDNDACEIVDYLNDGGLITRYIRDCGDWVDRISEKIGMQYHVCEDCQALEHEDSCTWAYNGDRVICESCCSRNYHYSDYQDTYIHDDDESDDEENNGLIGEYHSSSENLDHIPTIHDKHKNPVYLGLELEMETTEGADRYAKAEQLLDAIGRYSDGKNSHQYCLLENDGSLDDGFEMVSGWTGLDVHAKQLEFFKQPFRGMRSHDTRTCGLHIHICKNGMSMSHASKLILFINESSNQRLIKAIARRENPDYAKIKNKRADYRWLKNAKQVSGLRAQLMQLNEDRYEALNFKNPNTVEFRMFKGTLKYETIMACLEFTYASWHFARDTGISNLTTPDFLAYISKPAQLKQTKFLRAYLQSKGFTVPTPVKQNPREDQPAQATAEV